MKSQQFSSEVFQEPPFSRSHWPYRESTELIVKKGFVAAKIHALQEAQSQALVSSHSHSPMTLSPINQRLQKYESYSSPKPRKLSAMHRRPLNFSTESFANGVSRQIRNDRSRMSILRGRNTSSSKNTGSWRSQSSGFAKPTKYVLSEASITQGAVGRALSSNLSTNMESWRDVHIPGLEPTILATDSVLPSGIGEGPRDIDVKRIVNPISGESHQRTLLPRSSVADELSDVANVDSENHNFPSREIISWSPNRRDRLYLAEKSTNPSPYMSPPLSTELLLGSADKKPPVSLQSIVHGRSTSLEHSRQRKKYQIRPKLNQPKNVDASTNLGTKKIDKAVRNIRSPSSEIQRACTLQHPRRSISKTVGPIKLRSFSANHKPSRHSCNCDSNSHELAIASLSDQDSHKFSAIQREPTQQRFVETSNRSSCRQSGTSARTSSTVSRTPPEKVQKKRSWWKLALFDKQPVTIVTSKKAPSSVASHDSARKRQANRPACQHGQNRRTRNGGIAHTMAEFDHEHSTKKVNPPKTTEAIPKRGHDRISTMDEARSISYASSTNSYTEPISETLRAKVQKEQLSEWVATLPLEKPLRSSSATSRPSLGFDSLPAECRHTDKGKVIRKIQVVITFDEAADLVVEAYLNGVRG